MNTEFKTLFTVAAVHAYYNGNCEDIHFVVPRDVAQLLKNGRLLTKSMGGKLYILFEAAEAGGALAAIPGKTLRIGLQLANPFFSNFTEVGTDFASVKLLYRNTTVPTALSAATRVTLVGQVFSHTLTDNSRPVTVALKDAAGQTVETGTIKTHTIAAADNRTTVSYDLTGQIPGAYSIEEVYPASTKQIAYYTDAELSLAGVFGVLEVKIDGGFYAAAADFQIAFGVRKETLKYYVVATNYSDADFSLLSVTDAGFAEDGRSQINFVKVPSNSFTPAEISPAMLGNSSTKVVLFKSQTPVARTEKARKKIQLKKNGEVLITHLPQPSSGRTNADLIIPISKP
jgi:hypothetical protein